MRLTGAARKQKNILTDLEKLAKSVGLKVSTGKLIYAGLKLKSGQCSLRQEPWLIVDRTQPFEEQVELYRQAFDKIGLEPGQIPAKLREVLGSAQLLSPAQPA
ncbi:MAG: hypothetical protein LBR11_04650 [Deltaproteobacteria bacterium]|jgi:hypothetical protein|nr:hypothetical protein [Deltaproteobacteria bacterium]